MPPKTSRKATEPRQSLPETLDLKWVALFYPQVGREVDLSRNSQRETHTWVITLSAAIFAAFIALGGNSVTYPTEAAFLAVLVIAPLLFRFFVRSCLEYQILHRWIALRNGLDRYFYLRQVRPDLVPQATAHIREAIDVFYFQWKAPKPFLTMLKDNLQLAFAWPFIVMVALLIWGVALQESTATIKATSALVSLWMLYELISFVTYSGFRHQEPRTPLPEPGDMHA